MGGPGLAGAEDGRPGRREDGSGARGAEEREERAVGQEKAEEPGTEEAAGGRRGGGGEEGERGGARRRGREMGKAAEMAGAARRAAETGWTRRRAGAGGCGWRRVAVENRRRPAALGRALASRTRARSVFALAKPQRLYKIPSDPPNWLLMTP